MYEEMVTLSKREQKRAMVLGQVEGRKMTAEEAARVMGMTLRHVRRQLARYRRDGVAALAHGNRGRKPGHALDPTIRAQVVELAQGKYAGFNHQHLTEKLEEQGIKISRSSVRRILVGLGIKSPRKRRAPRHRSRRERLSQEGMLLQVDASRHDWLEGRGPHLSLLLAIDDATGKVPFALFREQEDAQGYLFLMRGIIERKGVPLALYTDKHGIFQRSSKERESLEEELLGEREPTQFGRALRELEVQHIFAQSPQAKGRVERLGGTFQDRLVSELRLAGASTMEEANWLLSDFLPRFSERFGVAPSQEGSAYREPDPGLCLDGVLCFKYQRTVASDNTVRFFEHTLQLLPGPDRLSYAQARVEVQERLDGSLVVVYQGKVLGSREAAPGPVTLRARKLRRAEQAAAGKVNLVVGVRPIGAAATIQRAGNQGNGGRPHPDNESQSNLRQKPLLPKPPPDHPWRRWVVTKSQNS